MAELNEIGRAVLRLQELALASWCDDEGAVWEHADVALWCFDTGEYNVEVRCGLSSIIEFEPSRAPQEAIEAAVGGQKQRIEDRRKKKVVTDEELIAVGRAVLRLPELARAAWYDHENFAFRHTDVALRCTGDGKYWFVVGDESWMEPFGPYSTPQEAIEAALAVDWARESRETRRHEG